MRSLFDTSKAAILARRYASEASRNFHKALKELRRAEEEYAAKGDPEPTPPPPPPAPEPSPELDDAPGSFSEMPTEAELAAYLAGADPVLGPKLAAEIFENVPKDLVWKRKPRS